eukprot:GHVN01075111.1.p1 GENE.GHVN01075111.1~~GHVN01075111.1.p1  ORF type:complete len:232 (+),score=15.29 GHVN01075111.1:206-901(+)
MGAQLLPDHIFGEGMAMIDRDTALVLTWKNKMAYAIRFNFLTATQKGILPRASGAGARIVRTFNIDLVGWGLTSDRRGIFWSTSGDDQLHEFSLPRDWETSAVKTLQPHRDVHLHCFGEPLKGMNELEYHPGTGTISGNIFGTNAIVEIDPHTGKCLSIMSIAGLYDTSNHRDIKNDVANGIAVDERLLGENGMVLTGKRWPWMYVVQRKPVFVNEMPKSWSQVRRRIQLM